MGNPHHEDRGSKGGIPPFRRRNVREAPSEARFRPVTWVLIGGGGAGRGYQGVSLLEPLGRRRGGKGWVEEALVALRSQGALA